MKEDLYNSMLEGMTIPDVPSKQESWNKLSKTLSLGDSSANSTADNTPVISIQRTNRKWVAVAASIAAIAVMAFLFFGGTSNITISTPIASTKTVELPDGSVVILNSLSEITFNESSWESNRAIDLKGEAEFQVEKGSEFTVRSASGQVSVLGTSFNVYDRYGEFEVACMTGKVAVENSNGEVILTPGEWVASVNGAELREATYTWNPTSWKEGVLFFENASPARVFRAIELAHGVSVEFPEWNEEKGFQGPVPTSSLNESLSIVCTAFDAKFLLLDDNKIKIESL